MIENLRILYKSHGGIASAAKSFYFWLAVLLCIICLPSIVSGDWSKITTAVMPSITGFTIAAFALLFAIIDPKSMKILSASDANKSSPLLRIAGSVAHAVVVQISSLILASAHIQSDKNYFNALINNRYYIDLFSKLCESINIAFSIAGCFLTFYGLSLVMAVVLSIFRILKLISDHR